MNNVKLIWYAAMVAAGIYFIFRKTKIMKEDFIYRPTKNNYSVTSKFGEKRGNSYHSGLDIAAPTGTPVIASFDGKVKSYNDTKYGGGLTVLLQGESYQLGFCHLSNNTVVKNGSTVKAGQVIGYTGNTGHSTGPHLHISLRPKVANGYGMKIDPNQHFNYV